jgi:hypothetical protein
MESLYLDISDYLPDEEAEAVERAIEDVNEEYILIPSRMNSMRPYRIRVKARPKCEVVIG